MSIMVEHIGARFSARVIANEKIKETLVRFSSVSRASTIYSDSNRSRKQNKLQSTYLDYKRITYKIREYLTYK